MLETRYSSKSLRRYRPLLGGALASLALAVFVGCSKEPDTDPVALEVNGQLIRVSEIQAQIDSLHASGAPAAANPDRFLESYLERQVALTQAYELGLDKDPELLRQWENLLLGRLRQDAFNAGLADVVVDAAAVSEYYDANLDQYTKPAQVRAALLRLELDAHGSATEGSEEADRLAEALKLAGDLPVDTKGFGALAMRYSDEGTSRFKGGDIGWLQAGRASYRWPDAVVDALFSLSEQAPYSEVITTADAVYVLKYLDSRAEVIRPLDDALQAAISKQLYATASAELKASLQEQWSNTTELLVHEDALNQLTFPTNEHASTPASSEALEVMPLH